MTTWGMQIACWIPKAKNTYSDYVILAAFPLQPPLHESASQLLYTYIACLVNRIYCIYCLHLGYLLIISTIQFHCLLKVVSLVN